MWAAMLRGEMIRIPILSTSSTMASMEAFIHHGDMGTDSGATGILILADGMIPSGLVVSGVAMVLMRMATEIPSGILDLVLDLVLDIDTDTADITPLISIITINTIITTIV